jgi:hypothetical protein
MRFTFELDHADAMRSRKTKIAPWTYSETVMVLHREKIHVFSRIKIEMGQFFVSLFEKSNVI